MQAAKRPDPTDPILDHFNGDLEVQKVYLAFLHKYGPLMDRKDLADSKVCGTTTSHEITNPKHSRYNPDFPTGFKLSNAAHAATVWHTYKMATYVVVRERRFQAEKDGAK